MSPISTPPIVQAGLDSEFLGADKRPPASVSGAALIHVFLSFGRAVVRK